MGKEKEPYTESQKEAIIELNSAMQTLFMAFVKIDSEGMQITEALECIGMEVPLFAKPAVNQLSGKLKDMRKEHLEQTSE